MAEITVYEGPLPPEEEALYDLVGIYTSKGSVPLIDLGDHTGSKEKLSQYAVDKNSEARRKALEQLVATLNRDRSDPTLPSVDKIANIKVTSVDNHVAKWMDDGKGGEVFAPLVEVSIQVLGYRKK